MNFNNYQYTAFLASGEILEADDFRTIYNAMRYRVRDDGKAAIIRRNSDNKHIAYTAYLFKHMFIWTKPTAAQVDMVKRMFEIDPVYGLFCWKQAHGLE